MFIFEITQLPIFALRAGREGAHFGAENLLVPNVLYVNYLISWLQYFGCFDKILICWFAN